MKNLIQNIIPQYQIIRQTIHANPELRYEEFQTAALVADTLKKIGLPIQTGIGKTGVVALLDTGRPGKTVALRADMDALPLLEETNLPYKSKNVGKMHACGHDGHTATLLAAAHVLTELRDTFSGKIKFIFQPAEEGGAGALAMIEDGVLDNPKVDAIFGYHNDPGKPLCSILARSGCTMYSMTDFTITIHGKGGHASSPETTQSPIQAGSELVLAINDLLQRFTVGTEPSVISVTRFNSGTANNVIPDEAILVGTIRAASQENANAVIQELSALTEAISTKTKTHMIVNLTDGFPATINTPNETELVLSVAREIWGEDKALIRPQAARASEDFSYFLEKIPGCYFFIGNGENTPTCHNSHYDFNDAIIPVGAEMLSQVAIAYLQMRS